MKTPAAVRKVLDGRAAWAVVHGECVSVMHQLPSKCAAHVITDPPYSEHVHAKQRRVLSGSGGRVAAGQRAGRGKVRVAELGFTSLTAHLRSRCAMEFSRLVQRWALVFSDLESVHSWGEALGVCRMKHVRVGIWQKIGGQPQLTGDRPAVGCEGIEIAHSLDEKLRWNRGGHPAFWAHQIAIDRNGAGERVHTTQKPLSLMLDLVAAFTRPGDMVLDPFCGSGTTGVACVRLGRRFVGIERDHGYAAIACSRIKAELCGSSIGASTAGQLPLLGPGRW